MNVRRMVLVAGFAVTGMTEAAGPRLTGVAALDRDYLAVSWLEGEVKFRDDGIGPTARGGAESMVENWVEAYGTLDTVAAALPANWTMSSADDPDYGTSGKRPVAIHRKTKISGMAQTTWDSAARDWKYETPLGHTLYLKLPAPLKAGKSYRLAIGPAVVPGGTTTAVSFDAAGAVSEALHVNLAGYPEGLPLMSADLYAWLGDGGARDYSGFEGAPVRLVDARTGERRDAGIVRRWKPRGGDIGGYDLTGSTVWTADVGPAAPGRYRISVDGIGASPEFTVGNDVYAIPFKVSVKGFYYMRIGEAERADIRPVPRQPRYHPGVDPADTKIVLTTMHPYHPEWKTFSRGDVWDVPNDWARFAKPGNPENRKALGGHSDALDWDRHLGHVSIIYDMLLPFVLTGGALHDDDAGIAESGNGIPDLLDEARNEVDFWLALRDGRGYSHGLTNPNREHVLYQAGPTGVAAWANAANAAMLADAFRIAGLESLKREYLTHASEAWEYAGRLPDPQLNASQNVGGPAMRGADFKITAAAYLFNLTGDRKYEDTVNELSLVRDGETDLMPGDACQIWAAAGYLLSPRPARYPKLKARMKASVIRNAVEKETAHAALRPSRRSSNNEEGYFHTAQNVQRTMLAHRVTDDAKQQEGFLRALVAEADWGLGRNPLNMIQMTTATTPLERYRSVENAYTSGRNDGTPGLHPGHTPYFNMDDWGGSGGMIMARPRWMAAKGHPKFEEWPRGECAFNTRWVWAHSEFTPQQTMRGKTALYGYLYGIFKAPR